MNVSRFNDVIYIDMYTNQAIGFIIATFVDTAHTQIRTIQMHIHQETFNLVGYKT